MDYNGDRRCKVLALVMVMDNCPLKQQISQIEMELGLLAIPAFLQLHGKYFRSSCNS